MQRRSAWTRRGGTPRFQSDIPSQQVEQDRASEILSPDIQQFGRYRELLRQRPPQHLGQHDWAPIQENRIAKVRMANRSVAIAVANVPQILMNQSMNRTQFIIGNTTGVLLLYNFGQPSRPGQGVPIPANQSAKFADASCPVDEIWITSSNAGGIVTAYESVSVFP